MTEPLAIVQGIAIVMMVFWAALGIALVADGDAECAPVAFGALVANVGWYHAIGRWRELERG